MTSHIENLLNRFIVKKDQKKYRVSNICTALPEQWKNEGLSDLERSVKRLEYMLSNETPHVYEDEKIAIIRTLENVPEILTNEEWEERKGVSYIHEQGKVCNINPDYMLLIGKGFNRVRNEINTELNSLDVPEEKTKELNAMLEVMNIIEMFAAGYRLAAKEAGNETVQKTFERIPNEAPETLLEALQFLRLIHFSLWCSFNYHNTLGRLDQYLYPYYLRDIKEGKLDKEEALDLIEEFFIACNKDTDLYTGMQQGDNGQSIVLGGLNPDGSDSYNELSDICLQASLELKLIDPKINVRVNKNTPLSLYEKGTQLTKQGLGFPQYSNDDIVIPALLKWGYEKNDAYNYVVAACWEFIIPGRGTDIPNLNTMSYVRAITETIDSLKDCKTFEDYLEQVHESIRKQAKELMGQVKNIYMEPAPLMSLMMENCISTGKDVSKGNHYNNCTRRFFHSPI